jgi:hypothetical protein
MHPVSEDILHFGIHSPTPRYALIYQSVCPFKWQRVDVVLSRIARVLFSLCPHCAIFAALLRNFGPNGFVRQLEIEQGQVIGPPA